MVDNENYIENFNSKLRMLGVTDYYYSVGGKLNIVHPDKVIKLTMPNKVDQCEFDNIAFETMSNLEYLKMPESIEKLNPATFIGNVRLQQVKFSYNLTFIGENAFKNNSNIVELDFGRCKCLRYIGLSAFENCSKLELVVLPKQFRYIGKNVFKDCTSIKEVVIQSGSCLSDELIKYSGIDERYTKVIRL